MNPIKTSLLEARVVTAGKGGKGGKVLDNLKKSFDKKFILKIAQKTHLTDTEGLTCRPDTR